MIIPAVTPAEIETARDLVRAYAGWLDRDHGVSLAFQDIAGELATWPGRYAPPRGALLLALPAAGTVALRALDETTCEIKRLYVTPRREAPASAPASPSPSSPRPGASVTAAPSSTPCPS